MFMTKKQSRLSNPRRLGVSTSKNLLAANHAEGFANLLAKQVSLGRNAQLGGALAKSSPFQTLGDLAALHGSCFRTNATVSFDASHFQYLLVKHSQLRLVLLFGFFLFLVEIGETLVEAIDLASGIQVPHLAGEERMTGTGNVQLDERVGLAIRPLDGVLRFDCRTSHEGKVSGSILEDHFAVFGMNLVSHGPPVSRIDPASARGWL